MFYFSFYNFYSGTSLYDSWLIMSYNLTFTSLPVVVLGVMDADLTRKTVLARPDVYLEGILSRAFNSRVFFKWIGFAFGHSFSMFMLIFGSLNVVEKGGKTENLIMIGTLSFLVIANLVILLIMENWSILFLVVTFFNSIGVFFVCNFL